MSEKIDFVVLWVDGNDPEWLAEKSKWDPNYSPESTIRFRDWDNMQYWFRAVEKFTPWVNKIHFVTWGHLPKFLNANHPKLNIVKHSDFLPAEVLPVFNSNPIELNLYRISGIADQFVAFNDDMFILQPLKETFFFKNNLPCDRAIFNAWIPDGSSLFYRRANNMGIVNKYFDKKDAVKKNWKKYFSLKYGKFLYRSIALLPWGQFTGFYDDHLPVPHLKRTYEEVWDKERDLLDAKTCSRFRSATDVTNWMFRYWRYAKGDFVPCSSRGRFLEIDDDSIREIEHVIEHRRYSMICLNDSNPKLNFEVLKERIKASFEKILPEKSKFEV